MSFVPLTYAPFTYFQSFKDKSVNVATALGSKAVSTYNSVMSMPSAIEDSIMRVLSVAGTAWRTKDIAFQVTKASIPAVYNASVLNIKSPKNIAAQSIVNISKDVLANQDNVDFMMKMTSAKIDLKRHLDSEKYMSYYSKPVFSDYFINSIKKCFCNNKEYGAVTEAALILAKELLSPIILLVAFFKALVPYMVRKTYIKNLDKYITKQFSNICKKVLNEEFLKKFFVKLVEKVSLLKNLDFKPEEISLDLDSDSGDILALSSELDKKFDANLNNQTKELSEKLFYLLLRISSEKIDSFDKFLSKELSKKVNKYIRFIISKISDLILIKESKIEKSLFHNLLNSLLSTDISKFNLNNKYRQLINLPKGLPKSELKALSEALQGLDKDLKAEIINGKIQSLSFVGALSRFNTQILLAALSAAEEAFEMDRVSEETFINAVGEIPNALKPAFIDTANEALKEMTDTTFSLTNSFPSPVRQVLNITTINGAREMIRANKASSVFANQKNTIAKYLSSFFKNISEHCNDENARNKDKKTLSRVKRQYSETLTNVSLILSPIKRAISALKPF